jgi:hypothetical protein
MGKFEEVKTLRILDFDIENRPESYWVPDMPSARITAIASAWVGDHNSMVVNQITAGGGYEEYERMLALFVERYNQADMVTGHYIRRHDLPIINGALYDRDMPLLTDKLTCDTKLDMMKKADVPATQEWLLELLDPQCPIGIPLIKYHMSQRTWRDANFLSEEGVKQTRVRVSTDVHAHEHMRQAMLDRGWLRAPSVWSPGGGFSEVSVGRLTSGEAK